MSRTVRGRRIVNQSGPVRVPCMLNLLVAVVIIHCTVSSLETGTESCTVHIWNNATATASPVTLEEPER
jgi:hypothetical protein